MAKALTPKNIRKKQRDDTKKATKTFDYTTVDVGRSVGDTTATQLVWLNPDIRKRVLAVRPHLYGLRLINNRVI